MTLHVNHRRKLRRRDVVARRKKRRTRHDDANELYQLVKIFRRRVSSAHRSLIKQSWLHGFCRAVRAPQLCNHFPRRREGTFRLRLFLRFVNVLERELRAGHQRGFAKLLIQLLRHVIHRAPAFFMRPPPKCRMRVQFFKVEHRNPNLPHRQPLAGHDAAKHLLHHFIDDGI